MLELAACAPPEFQKAEDAVRQLATDPKAVQIRSLEIVEVSSKEGASARLVCGEFNAKNGVGGYVGFEPFAYAVERKYSSDEEPDNNLTKFRPGTVFHSTPGECRTAANIAAICSSKGVVAHDELTTYRSNLDCP